MTVAEVRSFRVVRRGVGTGENFARGVRLPRRPSDGVSSLEASVVMRSGLSYSRTWRIRPFWTEVFEQLRDTSLSL